MCIRDRLYGETGDDILAGAAGADQCWGGEGADIFVFDTFDRAADRIYDFVIGEDRLDVSDWGATSLEDVIVTDGAAAWIRITAVDGGHTAVIRIGRDLHASDISAEDFIFA